jgi:TRAP-type C4-dicarboxylate transport system permease large subunit
MLRRGSSRGHAAGIIAYGLRLAPIIPPGIGFILYGTDGVDPVHFGLVFIIAATIGDYTPPVGAAMFVTCRVLRYPIGEYTRELTPFLIAASVVTLLRIFVPEVVLLVPNLIFGKDRW